MFYMATLYIYTAPQEPPFSVILVFNAALKGGLCSTATLQLI